METTIAVIEAERYKFDPRLFFFESTSSSSTQPLLLRSTYTRLRLSKWHAADYLCSPTIDSIIPQTTSELAG